MINFIHEPLLMGTRQRKNRKSDDYLTFTVLGKEETNIIIFNLMFGVLL